MEKKNPKKVIAGIKSRVQGKAFELVVRKDLESKGWIVDRWTNQVEFETVILCSADSKETIKQKQYFGKLVPAKPKMRFNPQTKSMSVVNMGGGFPDFVCFKKICIKEKNPSMKLVGDDTNKEYPLIVYDLFGVESKMTGKLDKLEKEKCQWLLDNHVFSKILIAEKTKIKNRVVVVYHDFKEKHGKI